MYRNVNGLRVCTEVGWGMVTAQKIESRGWGEGQGARAPGVADRFFANLMTAAAPCR